jgi:hypothetical protein
MIGATMIIILGLVISVPVVHAEVLVTSADPYTKGYVESSAKLPMSSMNKEYIYGYRNATADNFGISVKIPTHNLKDFYQGISDGAANTDKEMNKSGIGKWSFCPEGHTAEYCTGFNFGASWEGDARDGM